MSQNATSAWGAPESESRPWRSGPWALWLRGDELAQVTFDRSPVLRSIRAVVRDPDWNTVPVSVSSVALTPGAVALALRHSGFGGEFQGTLTVSAADGLLRISLEIVALQDFARNRIGLVALHPPSLAGSSLQVVHSDGAADQIAYPLEISPHQPARDIAELSWNCDGVDIRAVFVGEVFEMEDQRNWTDASYKTYSTPLNLPFPVDVTAGERIAQSIELRATRSLPRAAGPPIREVRLVATRRRLPSFGVGASTSPDPLPLARPHGDFLLVELHADQGNWRPAWERAVAEAAGRPLDVRIVASGPSEVAQVVEMVATREEQVIRLGVFSRRSHVTEPELWDALVAAADPAGMTASLLGGTRAHFTELNREHGRMPSALPALTFSSTPQMHAQRTEQLVEALPMQALTAKAAVRLAGRRPVHVGPVTLRPRLNAVATTSPYTESGDLGDGYAVHHVPDATDPRQGSEATAAWLVASASAFSVEGIASVAFFEQSGPRGLIDGDGHETPAARALRSLAELAGRPAFEPVDPLPANVFVLAAESDLLGVDALIANLNPRPITLAVTTGLRSSKVAVGAFSVQRVTVSTGQRRRIVVTKP